MTNINILLVDDDFIKISSIIKTIKEVYSEALNITQASCVQEAIEALQSKQFHLLITDLQMPLKYNELPNNKGGESLIRSIYKSSTKANVPMYIIGLTQFVDLQKSYKGLWKIWQYDSSLEDWKINLRDLIFHISLVKNRIGSSRIETLFVEGTTDLKLIDATLALWFPNLRSKIFIETVNYSGGSSWVERQLFIWAKSLTKNNNDEYIKAVGLFDNDEAGNKSILKIRSVIDSTSAEGKTFSVVKTSSKYSIILKSIKAKGISFPTTIEDLVSIKCWRYALSMGWLEPRRSELLEIDTSIIQIFKNDLSIESFQKNGFTDDEIFILTHKINDNYKKNFANMVCEMKDMNVLESIKFLLEDIIEKLKIESC